MNLKPGNLRHWTCSRARALGLSETVVTSAGADPYSLDVVPTAQQSRDSAREACRGLWGYLPRCIPPANRRVGGADGNVMTMEKGAHNIVSRKELYE